MSRLLQGGLAAITFFCSAAAGFGQETVKIGAVQGLSGPPAIVDFGESVPAGKPARAEGIPGFLAEGENRIHHLQ